MMISYQDCFKQGGALFLCSKARNKLYIKIKRITKSNSNADSSVKLSEPSPKEPDVTYYPS